MQKFSGIYMGRRRRQTGEPEAEMEGSGDDSEPQVLAGIAKELKSSIDNTQFTLQHHLQETQETMHRGQVEMRETLERLNASQEKIVLLLMQMNHGGDGPNNNVNREASGSHGGTRHHHEQDPHYHTEGQSFGGGPSRGQHTVEPLLDLTCLLSWKLSSRITSLQK
jgi:hypothetical protein